MEKHQQVYRDTLDLVVAEPVEGTDYAKIFELFDNQISFFENLQSDIEGKIEHTQRQAIKAKEQSKKELREACTRYEVT